MEKIALNCDLGESFGQWQMGNDTKMMPFIDQANIACGFHGGDPLVMQQTVAMAVKHNVAIGAHPSYPDLQGFGRRSMAIASSELIALIHYQLGALQGICQVNGTTMSYVKPHGALYNDMMRDKEIFTTICQAISQFSTELVLVIQAIPKPAEFQAIADQYQIGLRFEAFADRNYLDSGLLVPRSQPDAVIHSPDEVVARMQTLKQTGALTSINGKPLKLMVHTVCVHSDTQDALTLVKRLKNEL